MRVTDALLGEHAVFYAQFDHVAERIEAGASLGSIQEAAALLASALGPHAELENELLFDRLAERGVAGPFRAMHVEHDEIESLLEEVAAATDRGHAAGLLGSALELARQHFLKEEEVAFGMAERALGEAELVALGSCWAVRRGVRVESDASPRMR